MGLVTVPPSPFPPSSGKTGDIAERVKELENDVSTLQSTKAPKTDIAPAFSAETNYSVGDLVYYNGALYECTTEHTAGAWNSEHFTATAIDDQLNTINSNIASAQNDIDALNSGVLIRFSSMDSDGLVPVALPKGTTYTVTEVSCVGGNVIPADTTDGYHVTASNATAGFLIVMLHGTYKTQAEGKIIDVRVNVS